MRPVKEIGGDGLRMLALSSLLILATGGISWFWHAYRVLSVARRARADVGGPLLVVLGRKLRADAPSADFKRRLERAATLYSRHGHAHILILGGRTARARLSEAEAGRTYLMEQGIPPDAIHVEHRSRHTLENLREARELLPTLGGHRPVLITCRSHLARAAALAHGLGLEHRLCAAEDAFSYRPGQLAAVLREGYFLHWYWVGRRWSEWTGNHASLGRIN